MFILKEVRSTQNTEESFLTSIQEESDLIHSSSIYLYTKISLSFYLQVSCKYTYFTFTSSSAPRKERKPTLSKVGSAIGV